MQDKKHQILRVAKEAFLQQGYHATSIQSIADRCGISKGAIYLHFRAKQDILIGILDQIDEALMQGIEQIQAETHLLPKERLKKQILLQFEDSIENRAITDLFIRGTGVELTEELFTLIDEMRYRWQKLQETFLLKTYGPEIEKWVIDLTVILNGLMHEYSAYIFMDNIELDIEQASDFFVFIFESIIKQLKIQKPKPALSADMIPDHSALLEQAEERRLRSINELLNSLREELLKLDVDPDEKESLQETFQRLEKAAQNKTTDKVMVRALLASLREHKPLNEARENLARILKVKLV